MKPQACFYCESMVGYREFQNHIEICGSKTFVCQECGANVLKKATETHKLGECQRIQEQKRNQVSEDLRRFQEEE